MDYSSVALRDDLRRRIKSLENSADAGRWASMDKEQFLAKFIESIWDAIDRAFQKQSVSAINIPMGGTRIDEDGVGDVEDEVTVFVADSATAARIKQFLDLNRNRQ